MKHKSILPVFAGLAALSGCATQSQPSAPPPPPSVAAKPVSQEPQGIVWLRYPPASPVTVVGAMSLSIPSLQAAQSAKAAAEATATILDADFILVRNPSQLEDSLTPHETFAGLWPVATLPVGAEIPDHPMIALFLKRNADRSPGEPGFIDPVAGTRTPADRISLFRWVPGQPYPLSGRFVLSPFSPNRPPIDVSRPPRRFRGYRPVFPQGLRPSIAIPEHEW